MGSNPSHAKPNGEENPGEEKLGYKVRFPGMKICVEMLHQNCSKHICSVMKGINMVLLQLVVANNKLFDYIDVQ